MAGLLDFLFPSAGGVNPFSSGPLGLQTFPDAMRASAFRLGIKPEDLATAISYETGGTFDPAKKGPTTKWGQHKGLIQFGEPQAKKYGVDFSRPAEDQMPAVTQYLLDAGVKPGMGLPDIYSAINAGAPGRYNASDRPGHTVATHVASMAPHQEKAAAFLGGVEPTIQQDPSTFAQPPAPPTKEPVMADATADPISQLLAQYVAQQQGGGQSPGLLGQLFPALNNTRVGGLLNNPDLQDKLTSIGAGLASGRGWGPGFGAGVAMYQNQRQNRRDEQLQNLMLAMKLRQMQQPELKNIKDAAGNDVSKWVYPDQRIEPVGGATGETPVANFDTSQKLRKEVQGLPQYQNWSQAIPVYKSMAKSASNNTLASDIDLVYGIAKLFDPGSVVREGEMIMVQKAQALPQQITALISSVNGKARLDPQTRKDLMAEAKIRMDAYQGELGSVLERFKPVAKRYQIPMEDLGVLEPLPEVQWGEAAPSAPPIIGPEPTGATIDMPTTTAGPQMTEMPVVSSKQQFDQMTASGQLKSGMTIRIPDPKRPGQFLYKQVP